MKNPLPSIQALLARAQFWRKKADASETGSEADEALDATQVMPPMDAPPPGLPPDAPPSQPENEEDQYKPPLIKRILATLMKKSVWMSAAALLLIGISAAVSVTLMRGAHQDDEKAMKALQSEKEKLEAENKKLREQASAQPKPGKIIIPSPEKPREDAHSAQTQSESAPVTTAITDTPRKSAPSGADCLIADKGQAGESLKRCIEAFNQSNKR